MIDPETIEDIDDCDGESAYVYGFDAKTGKWSWGWLLLEHLYEHGRLEDRKSVV